MEQNKADQFSVSFPRYCVLGYVLLDTDPLDEVDSWKEVVGNQGVHTHTDQIQYKTMSNKKLLQKNKRSRSVTIQIPEDRINKNKESRSDNTTSHTKPRSEYTSDNPISIISDLQELRSVDDGSTQQRMTSVAGYPKNRLYIDSGPYLHILFTKEVLGKLDNINKPLKIQAVGKPFHIEQIGSLYQALRHLPLPVTVYHYSKIDIANLLSLAKLAGECYIICKTRIDNVIYVQSKDDGEYLQFQ